jgi:hypothetical protein
LVFPSHYDTGLYVSGAHVLAQLMNEGTVQAELSKFTPQELKVRQA